MYSPLIKEFGVVSKPVLVGSQLYFVDRYGVKNTSYVSYLSFEKPPSSTSFYRDLFWISYRNEDGTLCSYGIKCDSWDIVDNKKHYAGMGTPVIENNWYVGEGDPQKIVQYNDNSEKLSELSFERKVYGDLVEYKTLLYSVQVGGGICCATKSMKDVWMTTSSKQVFSRAFSVKYPMFFEELAIVNLGEDDTFERGSFEINAYQYNTGELIWQVIIETSPNSSHLADGKLYVCVNNRFRRIDALTGQIEIDETFDYKTFDGNPASIGAVYPLGNDTILCSSAESQILEIRTADAKSIIQTIQLPETYCYSGERPPVFAEDEIYLSLDHIVTIPFNLMKSGIAVLSPKTNASKNETAHLEERVPYTVEPAKDDAGNNAHKIVMRGDDPNKIIHCAHVVLKELAIKTGVAFGYEFEGLHDPLHAGKLFLEIDTSGLTPGETTKEEWLERFSIIKTRVDDELFTGRVAAGNKKNRYRVVLSVI